MMPTIDTSYVASEILKYAIGAAFAWASKLHWDNIRIKRDLDIAFDMIRKLKDGSDKGSPSP